MISILSVLLTLFFLCCGDSNEWRGVHPLKTIRGQVEQQLGRPTQQSPAMDAASYETKDGEVFISYTFGRCDSEYMSYSCCNVPEFTVIEIRYHPTAKIPFSDLKLDLNKFEKRADPDIMFLDEYTNEKEGVGLTVDKENGFVTTFRFFPSEKDRLRLCKSH